MYFDYSGGYVDALMIIAVYVYVDSIFVFKMKHI